MAKMHELKFEFLEHPPYSPHSSNEEVITAVEAYFADLPDSHIRDGIHRLEDRWSKCIMFREIILNNKVCLDHKIVFFLSNDKTY